MGYRDGRESEGVEFGERGYVPLRDLTLDNRVALLERAAQRLGGENLVAAIEFARGEAEESEQWAREWIDAAHRSAAAGTISHDVAFLFADAILDGRLLEAVYADNVVETLFDEMRAIEVELDSGAPLGVDPHAPMPSEWTRLDARLTIRLDDLRSELLESCGATEMARRWNDNAVGFAVHLEAVRSALHREVGVPLLFEYANARPRRVTGYRLLDEWQYTVRRQPTTAECVFLIESAVLERGDATLAEILDTAEVCTRRSKAAARRWIEAARRLRDAGVISRDVSFVFVAAMYRSAFEGESFDDPVAQAISAEQERLQDMLGMEEIRDADPEWYAPEAWWVLNRRWHGRIDEIECSVLRAVGEHELAAIVERRGGIAFDQEIAKTRETIGAFT